MEGRARQGPDARGSIGDVEPGGELVNETGPGNTRKAPMNIRRKGLGIGLLAIVIGLVIWILPHFDIWVLSYIRMLSTGPRIIAYGILLIILTIIADIILPKIINLLLD